MNAPHECKHSRLEWRKRFQANTSFLFIRQCLDCGNRYGTAEKHSNFTKMPSNFDEKLYEEGQQVHLKRLQKQHQKEEDDWQSWYSEYLKTSVWKGKRLAVLKRCNLVCEGCSENAASEVHHLTYKHAGDELLFELVGLCRKCHEKCHSVEALQ